MSDTDHTGTGRYTLTADADGGLVIQDGGEPRFAFRVTPGGWTVEGGALGSALRLRPDSDGTMVLEELEGSQDEHRPVAFWSPARSGAAAASGGTVLLADGDLFQVLDRPGLDPGYNLVGWQGGGPYFASGAGDVRMQVNVHPAGLALLGESRGETVLMMFAAVVAGLTAFSRKVKHDRR